MHSIMSGLKTVPGNTLQLSGLTSSARMQFVYQVGRPRLRLRLIGKWVPVGQYKFRFRIVCAGEPRGAAANGHRAAAPGFDPGSPAPAPSRIARFVSVATCTPRGTRGSFIRTGDARNHQCRPQRRHRAAIGCALVCTMFCFPQHRAGSSGSTPTSLASSVTKKTRSPCSAARDQSARRTHERRACAPRVAPDFTTRSPSSADTDGPGRVHHARPLRAASSRD